MSHSSNLPHPNCYRIPDSRVIAGEYPFHADPAKARTKLRSVLDAGVTVFVDLTEDAEGLAAYDAVLRQEAAARGLEAAYHRLSIVDVNIPTPRRMAEILACITAAEEAGHTVYLHCWGGVGRTGTVAGCYLVRNSLSGDEALAQVQALFSTMSPDKTYRHRHTGSPQTEPQRDLVRRWAEIDPKATERSPTERRAARMVEQLLAEHGSARAALLVLEQIEEREARELTVMERYSGPLGAQAAREETKRRLRLLATREEEAAPSQNRTVAANAAVFVGEDGREGESASDSRNRRPVLHSADAAKRDRLRGALIGLAVGDALGTTLEFSRPGSFRPIEDMVGGGPFRLKAGEWTDDTSMALCLAESLVECDGFDADDQMRRYLRWYREGYLSVKGYCFDIGGTTSAALERFERSGEPFAGGTGKYDAGNGSIMRLAPVPIFFAADPAAALQHAANSSRTTHGAAAAIDACRYLAALLLGAVAGVEKDELLAAHYSPVAGYWEANPLVPEVAAVAAGSFKERHPPEVVGSGYSVRSLEAALWAFHQTEDFRSGALLAVNLGDDADTTGAVYGQIAGAYYGESAIPAEWRERLAMADLIERLADGLAAGPALPTIRV